MVIYLVWLESMQSFHVYAVFIYLFIYLFKINLYAKMQFHKIA